MPMTKVPRKLAAVRRLQLQNELRSALTSRKPHEPRLSHKDQVVVNRGLRPSATDMDIRKALRTVQLARIRPSRVPRVMPTGGGVLVRNGPHLTGRESFQGGGQRTLAEPDARLAAQGLRARLRRSIEKGDLDQGT